MKTNDFKKVLAAVKPGLANQEFIIQSTNFVFMGDMIATYNDEISISYPFETEFTGAVDSKKLLQFINKLPNKEIKIKEKDRNLLIICGRSRASFPMTEPQLPLEEVGGITKWKKLPKDFIDGCKFVLPCCTMTASNPVFSSVNFLSNGAIQAANQYQAAQYKTARRLPSNFLIPSSSVKEIVNYELKQISLSDDNSWAHFKDSNDAIISCRMYQQNFPNVSEVIEFETATDIVFPEDILDAINRAEVIAQSEFFIDSVVAITNNGKGTLSISTEAVDGAKYSEKIKYKNNTSFSFKINPVLLKSVLKKDMHMLLGFGKIGQNKDKWAFVSALAAKEDKE